MGQSPPNQTNLPNTAGFQDNSAWGGGGTGGPLTLLQGEPSHPSTWSFPQSCQPHSPGGEGARPGRPGLCPCPSTEAAKCHRHLPDLQGCPWAQGVRPDQSDPRKGGEGGLESHMKRNCPHPHEQWGE